MVFYFDPCSFLDQESEESSTMGRVTEILLWSIDETARQMGGLSTRTIRRLIDRGEIPSVKIGRSLRIPAQAVHDWIEDQTREGHNVRCAGDVQQENSACHTNAKIVPFGGCLTPTQMARELDALLRAPPEKKQTRWKQSGS
jgi:excisionase family DNA binding protein